MTKTNDNRQRYALDQVAIRMVKEPPLYSADPITTPEDAVRVMNRFLRDYDREVFCVVALDVHMRPININIASMGTLTAAIIHPREVLKPLVLSNAASMMLAHNHPSGILSPSMEDIAITDRLVQLGNLLDIPVRDHVIIGGGNEYYSFMENSILPVKEVSYAKKPEDIVFSGVAEPEGGYKQSPKGKSGKAYDPEASARKRQEAMAVIADKLEQGVKDIFSSDAYCQYLKTMSKFHHYSLNNTLLIALQKPDATLVAGYRAWQTDHGRYVKKGEKGIQILAPAPYKKKIEQDVISPATGKVILDADGNPKKETVEVEYASFRIATVFDVSQTEGKELPTFGASELTGSVEHYGDLLAVLTETSPVPVIFDEIQGGTKGYYSTASNEIHVQTGMSELQTIKTLIHEISHASIHSPAYLKDHPDEKKDRHTKEVEAESIAYCVCQYLGGPDGRIDTSEYSFSYVAGWSSGKDVPELRASLQTIRDTADSLITEIEGRLKLLQKDREHSRVQSKEQTQDDPAAQVAEVSAEYRSEKGVAKQPHMHPTISVQKAGISLLQAKAKQCHKKAGSRTQRSEHDRRAGGRDLCG